MKTTRKVWEGFRSYWPFALAVFLSAFLLFQVQPLIGKYILPWFGGGFAVWTTAMFFFQLLLLGGYAYAHLVNRLQPRMQGVLHLTLLSVVLVLIIALSFLWDTPITPDARWKPADSYVPLWHVLRVLLVGVGLPYFLLSTTSSLVQAWFSRLYHGRSPYLFYALSNVASLFALVSYPFLFEPLTSLKTQATMWSIFYVAYVLLLGYCTLRAMRAPALPPPEEAAPPEAPPRKGKSKKSRPRPARPPTPQERKPDWKTYLLWIALAACASVMLLATTNQMTQDVASVPFLWVLPLSLYLLSFVICFSARQARLRTAYTVLLLVTLVVGWLNLRGWWYLRDHLPAFSLFIQRISVQIVLYALVLFACCLFCHGELYSRRPHPRYLTSFYLMLSIGGVLGGVVVGLLAPVIFTGFWEYHLGLIFCAAVAVLILFRDKASQLHRLRVPAATVSSLVAVLLLIHPAEVLSETAEMSRNFYGVLRVREITRGDVRMYGLLHGSVFHGIQAIDEPHSRRPSAYFTENSGIGLAMRYHPKRLSGEPLRIGVIGLGIGTLAAYGQEGDYIRFYEIDPDVVAIANDGRYFTYLNRSPAQVDIVLGDGRLSLQRELEQDGSQLYDILVMDAFAGDAVPVHLLTREAFEVYLSHLTDDGILAINITNKHLNLAAVAKALQAHFELSGVIAVSSRGSDIGMPALWVLLTSDEDFLANLPADRAGLYGFEQVRDVRMWTDSYSNLFQVLR